MKEEIDKSIDKSLEAIDNSKNIINPKKEESLKIIESLFPKVKINTEEMSKYFLDQIRDRVYLDNLLVAINNILRSNNLLSFYDSLEVFDKVSILMSNLRSIGKTEIPFFGFNYVVYMKKIELYYFIKSW